MWRCRYDLSKKCKGEYNNCAECMLDELKAEIEQKARPNEIGGRQNGKSIRYGLCIALEIIDKYRQKVRRRLHQEIMDYLDKNKVRHNHFMCEDCGFIHDFIDGHTAQYKYCPNCGAKMQEDKE